MAAASKSAETFEIPICHSSAPSEQDDCPHHSYCGGHHLVHPLRVQLSCAGPCPRERVMPGADCGDPVPSAAEHGAVHQMVGTD